jgi:hypothetical protein
LADIDIFDGADFIALRRSSAAAAIFDYCHTDYARYFSFFIDFVIFFIFITADTLPAFITLIGH